MKAVKERDGLEGYGKTYQWFTEISGLGLAEQARRLMHPDPPKKEEEEELAEYVDLWCERVLRLEAHGDKYVLPVVQVHGVADDDGWKPQGPLRTVAGRIG